MWWLCFGWVWKKGNGTGLRCAALELTGAGVGVASVSFSLSSRSGSGPPLGFWTRSYQVACSPLVSVTIAGWYRSFMNVVLTGPLMTCGVLKVLAPSVE